MPNLLLITDVPRLRKIFSKLTGSNNIQLRIANSLEKGAEELAAEKPAIVFVQTHLSGLSADILLMHLKKQLGRKRTRFVLLTAPNQVSEDVLKLYQGQLDTTMADEPMLAALRELVAGLTAKGRKTAAPGEAPQPEGAQLQPVASPPATAVPDQTTEPTAPAVVPPALPAPEAAPPMVSQPTESTEPSLEEQGITYGPRPRVSVYSEFTSSFDSAVDNMQPAEETEPEPELTPRTWGMDTAETVTPGKPRSGKGSFLLWLAPVLVAVVAITILQERHSATKPVDPSPRPAPTAAATPAVPTTPVPAPATGGTGTPAPPAAATTPKAGPQPATTAAETQLSDKAVLSAIAESRKEQPAVTAGNRPVDMPDFIPRYALDKSYGKANPGWERYKGRVTEFKVYREGAAIKAIQVIDRGGAGVPESFMKAAVRQVSKKPAFVVESTEKKEGYEIQRGHLDGHLNIVYYRDEQNGRLRAFVMTWK